MSTILPIAVCWSSRASGKSRRKEEQKTKTIEIANPAFNALTPFQENLYWRLRDLFQRYPNVEEASAEASDLKSTLYPLKRDLRESQVQSALTALTLAGMIAVYPDDTGHPYLRLISADSLTSHGGDIGGDEQRQQHVNGSLLSRSLSNGRNEGTVENVPSSLSSNEYEGDTEKGNAEVLGVTERDITETMERRNTIEFEARRSGLRLNERAMMHAEQLADQYSLEWLIIAIQRAYDCPEWRYVDKILSNAKERGTIADLSAEERRSYTALKGHASRKETHAPARRKTDAELDAELKKWGVNLGG